MKGLSESGIEHSEVHYFNPGPFETKGGLWCVRMGTNIAKPNYWAGPRTIECFGLHFVLQGSLAFQQEQLDLDLQAGDIFCLYPGLTFQYGLRKRSTPQAAVDPTALRLFWLTFQGPQAQELLAEIGLSHSVPYRRAAFTPALHPSLHQLLQEAKRARSSEHAASFRIQTELHRILTLLLPASPAAQQQMLEPANWFARCIEFMQLHYAEEITIGQIAQAIPVHRSHLTEVFTRQMGCSPHAYLQTLRMDKAKEMLRTTSRSISEIAYSVGYASLYSFSRAFRRHVGMAASEYRSSLLPDSPV